MAFVNLGILNIDFRSLLELQFGAVLSCNTQRGTGQASPSFGPPWIKEQAVTLTLVTLREALCSPV